MSVLPFLVLFNRHFQFSFYLIYFIVLLRMMILLAGVEKPTGGTTGAIGSSSSPGEDVVGDF